MIVNAPANGDTHSYSPQRRSSNATQPMRTTLRRCGLEPGGSHAARAWRPRNEWEAPVPGDGRGALWKRASHGWAASFQRQGPRTRIPRPVLRRGGDASGSRSARWPPCPGCLAAKKVILADRASMRRSSRVAIPGGISTRSAKTGSHGLTIIVFLGSVFSPYYKRSGRGNPLDHCVA